MDIQKLFRGISKKLLADFEISSQIRHKGNMGDYRENVLRKFLEDGKLPKRLGIGSGEIVGHISNVSKQSDLIIFDQLDNVPLLFDTEVQVYPIDCVYGIIEVKSKLTKRKLFEALDNIKSVKALAPNDTIRKEFLFLKQIYKRPKPFGFIFAYSLGGNSLDSLVENLKEWEAQNLDVFWPNLIVVLGEGIIYHKEKGTFIKAISSEKISVDCHPVCMHFRDDSFFYLYSYMLDLCNSIVLPKVVLSDFLDLPQIMGKYVVGFNDGMRRFGKDGKLDTKNVFRLTEKFIDKIVNWCKSEGPMTTRELYLKQFGEIPVGSTDKILDRMVYLYNPNKLVGMHEVDDPIVINERGEAVAKQGMIVPNGFITVDGETYYYPFHYLSNDDYEKFPG